MAATRILPIVWPTRTLYWSLDVISLKTATEFWPRGSYATPTNFRSARSGFRSDVVKSETNGSRRPSPSYAKTSRLISTFGPLSTAGMGAVGGAGFRGSGDGALDGLLAAGAGALDGLFGAGLAAVFGLGLDAACARAWADAPLASAATKTSAKEIERFIIVSPSKAEHMVLYAPRRSAPGTRCR